MSRFRSVFVCACLAIVLSAALPAVGAASRHSEQTTAVAASEAPAGSLAGSVLAWGRGAWAWMQAIIAEEHGLIVPLAPPLPPPPPPPPSDLPPQP